MKPNILFILIDDMGWKDLSCYGSSFYETPNIDKIANEGMLFTDGYAACPVCSPTRASILSGKYPARVGVTDWICHTGHHPLKGKLIEAPYIDHLPLEEKSLATTLLENGYQTWHVGKWHLGMEPYYPTKQGFEVNIGGCEMGCPSKGYFSPYHIPVLEDGEEGEYLTDRITNDAISLIKNRDKSKPFFLNFWHYAVHTPIQAPKELIEKYEKKRKNLGLDKVKEFEQGELLKTEDKKGKHVFRRLVQSDPAYAAMIENLDTNIGKVIEALRKEGLEEDTIVIFTSDNGGLSTQEGSPTTNAPLCEGKGWMYEGGVREPLFVKWPSKIKPNQKTNQYVTSPDFYPTILDLIGIDMMSSQHVDGMSFKSVLFNQEFDRGPIFWHYPHYGNQGGSPGSSVRHGDYKLIYFYEDKNYELYNLKEDIEEKYNIFDKEQEIAKKLMNELHDFIKDSLAKLPILNENYTD